MKENKYFPVPTHPNYLMKVNDLMKVDGLVNSYSSKCFHFHPPAGVLVFWLRKMDFLTFFIIITFNRRALSSILILRATRASDIHSASSLGPSGWSSEFKRSRTYSTTRISSAVSASVTLSSLWNL